MARLREDYDALTKVLEPTIVRWEHATFALDTLDPYASERNGWKPGRKLRRRRQGAYSYGYDAEGRVIVTRRISCRPA